MNILKVMVFLCWVTLIEYALPEDYLEVVIEKLMKILDGKFIAKSNHYELIKEVEKHAHTITD